MGAEKAKRPAADEARGPLKIVRLGRQNNSNAKRPTPERQDGPNLSPMQSAFLAGLVGRAKRTDPSITPVADVDPNQLRAAVVSLCAKGERGAS
jgi:hypothetical protein